MSSEYSCDSCDDQEDCCEYDSQAVRDVSNRCGLTCHSTFTQKNKDLNVLKNEIDVLKNKNRTDILL